MKDDGRQCKSETFGDSRAIDGGNVIDAVVSVTSSRMNGVSVGQMQRRAAAAAADTGER